jgi:hypothetical protein
LRLGAERRGERPGQRGQQEAAAVHGGSTVSLILRHLVPILA